MKLPKKTLGLAALVGGALASRSNWVKLRAEQAKSWLQARKP